MRGFSEENGGGRLMRRDEEWGACTLGIRDVKRFQCDGVVVSWSHTSWWHGRGGTVWLASRFLAIIFVHMFAVYCYCRASEPFLADASIHGLRL